MTDEHGGEPDGVVDQHDPWFWFCYDESWRIVAVFRDDDEDPKEVFVHHNAGVDGYGGSSYIDSVILRDRDTSTAWHEEAGDVRGERVYYCQNWRADVSAVLTDSGKMLEWIKYSAYGVPFAIPAGDTNSDGAYDGTDHLTIINATQYDVRKDADLDGVVDGDDAAHAWSVVDGYQTLGRGVLTSTGVNNRRGYAGYEFDPTFQGAGRWLYHVRHRVYDADVGRWTRRDPLGYVDGMSLYEYIVSRPVRAVDPWGLLEMRKDLPCAGGICQPPTIEPDAMPNDDATWCSGANCSTAPPPCPSYSGDRNIYLSQTQPGTRPSWFRRNIVPAVRRAARYIPVVRIIPNCFGQTPGTAVGDYAGLATTAAECANALPGEDPTAACRDRIMRSALGHAGQVGASNMIYNIMEAIIGGAIMTIPSPYTVIGGGVLIADAGINTLCATRDILRIASAARAAIGI